MYPRDYWERPELSKDFLDKYARPGSVHNIGENGRRATVLNSIIRPTNLNLNSMIEVISDYDYKIEGYSVPMFLKLIEMTHIGYLPYQDLYELLIQRRFRYVNQNYSGYVLFLPTGNDSPEYPYNLERHEFLYVLDFGFNESEVYTRIKRTNPQINQLKDFRFYEMTRDQINQDKQMTSYIEKKGSNKLPTDVWKKIDRCLQTRKQNSRKDTKKKKRKTRKSR
tara:strand:- start:1882 stop:2550 length:669 start_codon:yes stop_codon:yes gene_type:complete